MAMQAKDAFTIIVEYVDKTTEKIEKVKNIRAYTNKNGDILCYVLSTDEAIIRIGFDVVFKLEIQGTKDAKFIPDIYS